MYGNYPDLKKIKKILVIKLRHLGDVLLTTPVFFHLKKYIPWAKVDAYVYDETKKILENNPYIDEIISFDRSIKKYPFFKKNFQEYKLIKKMKKNKYDMVIHLSDSGRGHFLSKMLKTKYSLGYGNFYTHNVKIPKKSKHTVEFHLDFIRRLGIVPKEKELFFSVSRESYKKIQKILEEKKFKDFILIHPTSRWRFKCYPIDRMRGVVKKLIEKDENIVFSGGDREFEKEITKKIIYRFPEEKILNLSSKTSLQELGALIDLSKHFLCIDTFFLHLASFLKAKGTVIFGPTDEDKWGPWQNKNCNVITKNCSCRPCGLDGCGGSKISDCMDIEEEKIIDSIYIEKFSPR